MSDSKIRVRRFPGTVVSLLLSAAVFLIAGQAMLSAEVRAQTESSASVPSTEQRASDDAAGRAIYGQRYIGLYDGDTFVGDHAVTREQLLVIIDRVLRDIEAGKILVESSDAQLLRTLVVEFQDKLVDLNNRVQVLDAEMQVRHKRDVVLTEQTLQVKEEANDLMAKIMTFAEDVRRLVLDQAASNSKELKEAADSLSRFEERIDEFGERIDEIAPEIDDLQASLEVSVADLRRHMEELKHELNVTASRFSTLRTDTLNTYNTLVSRMDGLEKQLTDALGSAEEKIAAQEQRISQLERQLVVNQAKYEMDLKALSDTILSLSARVSALESGRSGASSGGSVGAEAADSAGSDGQ